MFLASIPLVAYIPIFGILGLLLNLIGIFPHSMPITLETTDKVITQARTTWDIFPKSQVACFLFCGANAHLTHHIFPTAPRSEYVSLSADLEKKLGIEYRAVHTFTEYETFL